MPMRLREQPTQDAEMELAFWAYAWKYEFDELVGQYEECVFALNSGPPHPLLILKISLLRAAMRLQSVGTDTLEA